MNNSSLVKLVCAAALTLLFCVSLQAQQGEPIGLMLSTTGVVSAEDMDGNVRRLQRRSPVYEGDTLITANRARAQVRFNDRGLIALQPNTSFFIEEHKFEGQEDGTESAIYSLLRGGLQAITGLIGFTNRENYQVSTPLATIGLRGTHWAATICTTACDGNPPGLYGGVADGGIDVCNGGGCTAVGTNTYFYTPDANTAAETLLAPPSVVFAATPEDEEGDEEEEEVEAIAEDEGTDPVDEEEAEAEAEAGAGAEAEVAAEPAADTVTDVAAFVERSVQDAGTTLAAIVDTPIEERVFIVEVDEVIADRNEEVVTEVITEATRTQPAPAGSVVALATARGVGTGNAQTAALNILINPTGTDDVPRAGFLNAATGAIDSSTGVAQTTTALAALDFDLSEAGCAPCLYATAGLQGTSATLDEVFEFNVDGVNVFMGRWTGDALLLNSGVDLNALQNHHYAIALAGEGIAFSPAIPSVDLVDSNSMGAFTLIGATSPTDASGNVGTLNRAELVMDFFTQVVTSMELDISFADERDIFAHLNSGFGFADGSVAGLFAPLSGYCVGGSCGELTEISGDTSLSFIGASAENILGAYALDTETLDQSVFGTYLLGLDFTFDPRAVNNPLATITAGVAAVSVTGTREGEFAPLGTTQDSSEVDIGLFDIDTAGADNVLVSILDIDNQEGEGGSFEVIEGVLEQYGQTGSFIADNNIVDESGQLSTSSDFYVNFGRWDLLNSALVIDGQPTDTTADGHFAYSNSPTDLSAFLTEHPFDLSAPILSYSLVDATSPTDEAGNLGELLSADLQLDLYQQLVSSFSLSLDIADREIDAWLSESVALNSDNEIMLLGECFGGDCGEGLDLLGDFSFALLGAGAEGAIGNFGLFANYGQFPIDDETLVSDVTANGVFVLGRDSVVENPNWFDGTPAQSQSEDNSGLAFAGHIAEDDILLAEQGAFVSFASQEEGIEQFFTLLDATPALYSFTVEDEYDQIFFSINPDFGALLIEQDLYEFSNDSVVWGRWLALDGYDFSDNGEDLVSGTDAHFIWASSTTDPSALTLDSTSVAHYSFAGGTSPTDEFGNAGKVNDIYLDLDFFQQAITDFGMEIEIADRLYTANIDSRNSTYYLDDDGETELDLAGLCVGSDCGEGVEIEGETSLIFVGDSTATDAFDQMSGIIGSYALATTEVDEGPDFPVRIFDLFINEPRETSPGEVIFDGPYVSAAGTYFLLGEQSDNEFYVDYLGSSPPSPTTAEAGIATFATAIIEEEGASSIGLPFIIDAQNELLELSEVGGVSNVVSGFTSDFQFIFGSEEIVEISVQNGVLAESGNISDFMASNGFSVEEDFDVNWGRWYATTELIFSGEGESNDIPISPSNHHYVYTDAVSGILPSFDNPSQVIYRSVDGPSPTDGFGRTGTLDAMMALDLYTQKLASFELDIHIADATYLARYDEKFLNEFFYSGRQGIDLANLQDNPIFLQGACFGGDCDYYDEYFNIESGAPMFGYTTIAAFGPAGEGFLGSFSLFQFTNEESFFGSASVTGSFVLAQTESRDHIGWQVDPVGVAAASSAVAAISGTVLDTSSSPTTFHPFSGIANPADLVDGASFTTIAIEDHAHIVDSITNYSGDCDICSVEVQDAVVFDLGRARFNYQYFTGDRAEVSWASWLNQESENNEWVFEDNDQTLALESSRLLSTIYADNLTQTDLTTLNPLTGYGSSASYSYAGGPAPVATGPAELTPDLYTGRFSYVNLDIDFASQVLKNFDSRIYFGESGDVAYRSVYLEQGELDFVSLTPTMDIDLTGYCSGDGCGSGGYDSLAGEVSLALVGDSAEQIIGGLSAWSDGYYYPMGTYGVDAGFILEQDYEGWVIASGFAVDVPTLATFAPIYFDSEIGVATYVPLLGIDSGLTTVEIDTTDYLGRFSFGEPVPLFTNYSDGTFEFGLEEGYIDSIGQVSRRLNSFDFDEDDNNPEPLFTATWGLWDSQSYVENLVAEGLVSPGTLINYLPFVVSRDYTQVFQDGIKPFTGGSGTRARYEYVDGSPTVNLGGLGYYGDGGEINKISMQFDLSSQTVQQFYISATDPDDYDFEAEMTAATDLGGTYSIALSGNCLECGSSYENLAVTGSTWLGFLGGNAEGAAGSFGLGVDDPGSLMNTDSAVITGAYVLEQNDHTVDLPETTAADIGGVVAFAATENVSVEGISLGFYLDGTDTATLTSLDSFDHNHPNAVVGIDVTGNANCGDCSYSMNFGELSDYDRTFGDNSGDDLPEAYWGRWKQYDDIEIDGSQIGLTDYVHWAYSPDPSDYSDPVWSTDVLGDYDFATGTNPTDNWGNQGYIDDIYMQLNFQSQTVVQFDLDASVGGFYYATSMSGSAALDATDPFANIALSGTATVSGSSPSTYSAIGNSSVFMLGAEADAAIGSFDLNAIGADHTVNGAFLLEQTSLIAIPLP